MIVVLGSERLYNDMSRRFSKQGVSEPDGVAVIKLDKSGGCVDRDPSYLLRMRESQIREYFFGTFRNQLSPYSQQLSFDEIVIYRPSEGRMRSPLGSVGIANPLDSIGFVSRPSAWWR